MDQSIDLGSNPCVPIASLASLANTKSYSLCIIAYSNSVNKLRGYMTAGDHSIGFESTSVINRGINFHPANVKQQYTKHIVDTLIGHVISKTLSAGLR